MEVSLKRNYGFELIFKAENVTVTEDIEERIYPKNEEGKIDFKKSPKRDIKTDVIDQFVRLLDDMIEYREAEYDSSDLIKRLFDKLPPETANKLAEELASSF